jgi:hypothetical protein
VFYRQHKNKTMSVFNIKQILKPQAKQISPAPISPPLSQPPIPPTPLTPSVVPAVDPSRFVTPPPPNNPAQPLASSLSAKRGKDLALPPTPQQKGQLFGKTFDWQFAESLIGGSGFIVPSVGDVGINLIVPALFTKRRLYAACYAAGSGLSFFIKLSVNFFRNGALVGSLPMFSPNVTSSSLFTAEGQGSPSTFNSLNTLNLYAGQSAGAIQAQFLVTEDSIFYFAPSNTSASPNLGFDVLFPYRMVAEFDTVKVSVDKIVNPANVGVAGSRVVIGCYSEENNVGEHK